MSAASHLTHCESADSSESCSPPPFSPAASSSSLHDVDTAATSPRSSVSSHSARRRVRAVLMRAGTSKGLFFHLTDLPTSRDQWGPVILAAMGSPDENGRQLDGLGGGQSTQSKVAVVSRSEVPGIDVDYLFIQVPIDGGSLDFSGNCGNMASGVGPFAVDEGLVPVKNGELYDHTVKIRNVNTNRVIHSTFAVENGIPVEEGDLRLDGVGNSGSPIRLDFVDPAGSMTGRLLPTGSPTDVVSIATRLAPFGSAMIATRKDYVVSCVDAANPFIFITAATLGLRGNESIAELTAITPTLMAIRAAAAVKMGLATTLEGALLVSGTPKIAIVAPPADYTTSSGRKVSARSADILVRAYSMGKPHPAIQMTGAVCVGAASAIPGSLVNQIVSEVRRARGVPMDAPITIGHASGTTDIQGEAAVRGGLVEVKSGSVFRTARRLMEGSVLYLDKSVSV